MSPWWRRLKPDTYSLAILGCVGLASLLPARGGFALGFHHATTLAIALLFFLHGARLPREAVIGGLAHWRLHLLVFSSTFLLFPLAGLALSTLLPASLAVGMLFLCCLPSTVQSSIAFTSIARGNVAAAICSASASNMLGVFLTPLLAGLLIRQSGGGGIGLDAVEAIMLQLLAPFAVGQLLRPWIGAWAGRHRALLSFVDRGSILMVVYGAFSEAVTGGLWHRLPPSALLALAALDLVLLALALLTTHGLATRLGFNRADRIAIVFCGSKKSLASGVPIANVLFSGPMVGMVVLPVMLFHQFQLMACAVLARRWGEQAE